jgi:microcystin degradation protein MlrC
MIGMAWADVSHNHVTALVVAADVAERQAAQAEVNALAAAIWARRAQFGFDVETLPVDEAIQAALAAPESTVFITDSGDNLTAGAVGDVPFVLERLLALRVPDAIYAAIADADATARCYAAGVGATMDLIVGGKLDPVNGRPFALRGRVVHLAPAAEGIATVQVAGVQAILTRERRTFTELNEFRQAGIEALAHKIVVTKLGYLFPELRDVAPRAIMALSPGFADQILARLPYRNLTRPVYPLDRDVEWKP